MKHPKINDNEILNILQISKDMLISFFPFRYISILQMKEFQSSRGLYHVWYIWNGFFAEI